MLLLIPLLPLVGFVLNASFGRRLTKTAAGAIACGAMLVSFAVSVAGVAKLVAREPESGHSRARLHVEYVRRLFRLPDAAARPVVVGDDPDHYRHRVVDSHLFHRLHARGDGRRIRAVLLLPQPVRGLHARPRARREFPRDVRRVGGVGLCRTCSSASGTRSHRHPTPARRLSSSTVSATGGSSLVCCSRSCASDRWTSRTWREARPR